MAITIKYVRSDAVGEGTGNTNTVEDAYTLAEVGVNHAPGIEFRFINSGTFLSTGNQTYNNDGTGEAPIIFTGRNLADTNYENCYINGQTYYMAFNGKSQIIKYIDIVSSTTGATLQINDAKSMVYNCKIKNTSTTATGAANALCVLNGIAFNNYIESITNYSSLSTVGTLRLYGGIAFGNKIISRYIGILQTGATSISNNLIIGNSPGDESTGIYKSSFYNLCFLHRNTIYNFTYGISIPGSTDSAEVVHIIDNLFHTIQEPNPSTNPLENGYCIYLRTLTTSDYMINTTNNRYYNCDNFSQGDKYNLGNVECISDPFNYTDVSPSYDINPPDYTLNDIADGGTLCRNIVYPAYNWTWNH